MKFNKTLNSSYILNFLFFLFPITYIIGNFAINLFTIFTILTGIYLYKKELLYLSFLRGEKIFIFLSAFFLVLIISTSLNYENLDHDSIKKSFLYLRYLVFTVVVSLIIKKNSLDFKFFLLSCLLCSLFLSLDVIYQSINGSDVFGFSSTIHHNSGFFGNEKIAGSYIQRFFLLGIFFIPLFLNKDKKSPLFIVTLLLIGFAAIVLSGNRMPMVMFVTFVFFSFIFFKKLRISFLVTLIIMPLIYLLIFKNDKDISSSHASFWENINDMLPSITNELKRDYPELKENIIFRHAYKKGKLESQRKYNKQYYMQSFGSGHVTIYVTAIDTWLDSILIGSGIKSFRVICQKKLYLPNRVCESHPHNYYLSILNSAGIVGLALIFLILFLIFKNYFNNKIIKNEKIDYVALAILISLLMEFFPIRSTGGLFSTQNSTFIFLLLGISLGMYLKKTKK